MGNINRNLWLICCGLFFISLAAVSISSLSIEQKLLFAVITLVLLRVTRYGFVAVQSDPIYAVVYGTIAAYLWFAYPGKLAGLVYVADSSWIADISFLPTALANDFADAFFVCSPGLMTILLGLSVPRLRRMERVSHEESLGISMFFFILGLLLLKVVLQVFLDIATPGVVPKELGIPFLVGILAFFVGFFLLTLVNVYLYHAILEKNAFKLRLAFFLVILLVLSDLWVGYKQALVIQAVVLSYYFSVARSNINAKMRGRMTLIMITVSLAAIIIYKYVNDYRYALLKGYDVWSAISTAVSGVQQGSESSLVSFVNRINGLDNFFAAMQMHRFYGFDFFALFDQSLGGNFNDALYDGEDVNTQFGLTQFGALYVVGGMPLMIVGAFVLGCVMRGIARLILNKVLRRTSWAYAFAPILALWLVKVLFAGGVLLLYAKEIFFVGVMLYWAFRFFSSGRRHPLSRDGVIDAVPGGLWGGKGS